VQEQHSQAAREARGAVTALADSLTSEMDVDKAQDYLRALLRQSATDTNRNTPPKEAVKSALVGNGHWRGDAYSSGAIQNYTKFFREAQKLDSGRSKKYWSTPVEMLARGFESFLFDAAKGGSPYLVGPSRADGAMSQKTGYEGAPYPMGKERAYVAERYKEFLDLFDRNTSTVSMQPEAPLMVA